MSNLCLLCVHILLAISAQCSVAGVFVVSKTSKTHSNLQIRWPFGCLANSHNTTDVITKSNMDLANNTIHHWLWSQLQLSSNDNFHHHITCVFKHRNQMDVFKQDDLWDVVLPILPSIHHWRVISSTHILIERWQLADKPLRFDPKPF